MTWLLDLACFHLHGVFMILNFDVYVLDVDRGCKPRKTCAVHFFVGGYACSRSKLFCLKIDRIARNNCVTFVLFVVVVKSQFWIVKSNV